MRDSDFIKLLKSHTECLLDEKKFRGLLNDLFPTEVQMNNILVNLYRLGLPKELEESESINDSVYFKYKKSVVKVYGIDQKLADTAIRLWLFCYGEHILGREIKISAAVPQVSDEGQQGGHNDNGIKSKDFSNCPFKVMLPQLSVLEGKVSVKFRIMSKPGIRVDVALNEIYLSDKLNRKYDQYYNGIYMSNSHYQKEIKAYVDIHKRDFLLSDSNIILYLLAGDNRKYEISYTNKRGTGVSLEYVMSRNLNSEERSRLQGAGSQTSDEEEESVEYRQDSIDDVELDITSAVIKIPKIEEYKKAVLREKYFIQNEGGRKYKVTNGNLISSSQGYSTYSFEMESELNLSDDAPISLSVGSDVAKGSVIVCEGFQIIIVVDRDFGAKISQAFIGVEPWKLLEALVNKLDNIGSDNELALKLIEEGPDLATSDPPEFIPKGQDEAISAAERNDITVIWGPPGTGKTYTMSEIARNALIQGKTILVVSHSNVSVDGVVKQTVAGIRNAGMEDILRSGEVLRYGYVRDEELSKDPYSVAYNYALLHRPEFKERTDQLHKEREKLKQTGGYLSQKREQIEKELKKIRSEIRSEERQYVEKAKLVATTISKVTIDPLFDVRDYDIVMFDEVSMAYVPQIVCAAMYAREKFILVGDFRQLAPIVQSDAQKTLEVDVFSYLGIALGSKVYAHPWLVMLNEQRRMHPDISAFPNKYIYNNLLSDHESVKTSREEIVSRNPLSGNAVNLINLYGTYAAAMKNSDNSRFNILSAIISFTTSLKAEGDDEKSIGIITPYAAQTRLIRAMIQDHRKSNSTDVACSTVHQFQGSERDLIIFDAVESYPASKVGWLMGKVMNSVTRLINVAVTRARGKLIVVANAKFWEMKFDKTQHIFWKLVKYLSASGNEISIIDKRLAPYISELPSTRNIRFYGIIDDAIAAFAKDVSKAHEKIVISIPDGKLDAETQEEIFKIIMGAAKNGIHVLCKTKGYEDLPGRWKNLAWASDNAVFPLIIIDDNVAWYGLPKSRGQFIDGTMGFGTVCHTCYRITGEHTLEMIRSFSDFEYREVNGQRKPLLEKKSDGTGVTDNKAEAVSEDDGTGAAGLDRFVRKMEKCPKCKSPMTVARGKSGKCYLKCSSPSCKEMAYLTPELTNMYINRENVKCPIHNAGLWAALNKYGIYVKCDYGHYLKPDEI